MEKMQINHKLGQNQQSNNTCKTHHRVNSVSLPKYFLDDYLLDSGNNLRRSMVVLSYLALRTKP